ncbi:hypothetical protein AB0E01_28525, partial [Nocardia vinacea]|uniref:hypothetical protein n=1 Tax=Nocardia vinacea TaxID=96468 RepID=UPI0033C9B720
EAEPEAETEVAVAERDEVGEGETAGEVEQDVEDEGSPTESVVAEDAAATDDETRVESEEEVGLVAVGAEDLVTYSSSVVLATDKPASAGEGAAARISDHAAIISDQARIIAKLRRRVMVLETMVKAQEAQAHSLVGLATTYKNELSSLAADLMDL